MRVPVTAPTRLSDEERDAVRVAVERVLSSDSWILGPEVDAFEADFAQYADLANAVGVGNGTDALVIALLALDLTPGAGVLVAANEGGYAATAARLAGLVPVVMDVEADTMTPSTATAAAADQAGVEAIVLTHLHGNAVLLGELDTWRRGRGLALIEDCAQAHGLRVDGRHVGADADAATYSFYPTKNLGAVGDGGLVGFADSAVARRARALRQYGWDRERFRVDLPGGRNTRLDPLQAAILRARLPHLDEGNRTRRRQARRWAAALAGRAELSGDLTTTVAHHAVVVTESRDHLAAHLSADGIDTAVHYPYLVGEMPGLAAQGPPTPTAADLAARILSLPCSPTLTEDELDRVEASLTAGVLMSEQQFPVHTDPSGQLMVVEGAALDFDIARVFTVTGVAGGSTRGGHLADCTELLVLVGGTVTVELGRADGTTSHVLTRPGDSVRIHEGDYVDYSLSADAVIVVLCDAPFRRFP